MHSENFRTVIAGARHLGGIDMCTYHANLMRGSEKGSETTRVQMAHELRLSLYSNVDS